MPWPTPQEYNEAIQNPALNVADPELAAGRVEINALGLPRPITGNFASVYRLHCSGRDWAVRCFWREYADMRERYAAISRHLRARHLPYTVGFEYLPKGIRVGGSWYPILKMEWVEGELLGSYIERHLADASVLKTLGDRWRAMIAALEGAGIAHGDLQHGNVLVVQDALRLVDYDALFVPELRGRGSHELGHQNYQHPVRTERDYGLGLDRFSAFVIECSIRALAQKPELWATLRAGDESLLFRRSDFTDPGGSPAFRLINSLPDAEVVRLSDVLERCLKSTPMSLPALTSAVEPAGVDGGGLRALRGSLLGSVFPGAPAAANANVGVQNAPGWLLDHLVAPAHPRPSGGVRIGATGVAASSALWVVCGYLAGYPVVADVGGAAGGFIGAAGILLAAFHGEGEVRAMKRKLQEERRQRRALRALEREVVRYERRKAALQERFDRAESRAEARLAEISRREQEDGRLAAEMQRGYREKAEERKRRLREEQKSLVKASLQATQSQHVRRQLRHTSIRSAPLPLVIRVRLHLGGVHNAAGVDMQRMSAIRRLGEDVAEIVAAWRVDAELAARKTAPTVLPAQELQRLTDRFGREHDVIERSLEITSARSIRLDATIREYWDRRRRPVREGTTRREAALRNSLDDLESAVGDVHRRMEPLKVRLARARRDLEPYGGLSFGRYLAGALTGKS